MSKNTKNIIPTDRILFACLTAIAAGMLLCCQKIATQAPPSAVYPKDSIADGFFQKAVLFFPENADSVVFYGSLAAEQAEKIGDWHTWGDAKRYLLTAFYIRQQFTLAAEMLPSLKVKAENYIPQDTLFWMDYYNNGGAIFNKLGDYEKALAFGKKEMSFYDKARSKTDFGTAIGLALANNNVSIYYLARGDYKRAWDYSNEARRLYESFPQTDPSDKILIYSNLGKIRLRQKEYTDARFWSQKALDLVKIQPKALFEANPNLFANEADFNLDIANSYASTMDYDKALAHLQQSLYLEEKHQLNQILPYTLHSLSTVLARKKQYNQAEKHLLRSMKSFNTKDVYYGKLCWVMGTLCQEQGRLWEALRWHQNALRNLAGADIPENDDLTNPELKGLNAYSDIISTLKEKGKTLRLLSRQVSDPALLKASLDTYQLATEVLDSMRYIYQEGSKQFWNEETRPILENGIELALQLFQSTGDEQYLSQAFSFSEKGKAYLLAEALRESAAEQTAGIPQKLLDQEKEIKLGIAFYKNKIFEATQSGLTDKTKISLWESEIHLLRNQEEDIKTKLESNYPEYYQIKYEQSIPTIAEIQKELPENTGLLEYFQGDSAIYAFYIDRQGAKAVRCGSDKGMMPLLQGMNDDSLGETMYSATFINAYAKNAADLYQNLVAPVLTHIPKKLILIPDGQLAYLPFDMLLTQEAEVSTTPSYSQLPYLLLKTTIQYEYSTVLAFQKNPRKQPTCFFDGYAPVYGKNVVAVRGGEKRREINISSLASLSNNQKEVAAAALLTGGTATLGLNATKNHFLKHASEPRILHLAMHGFVDDDFPSYSGLIFTPSMASSTKDTTDCVLFVNDIYNLHLNADLAVLSACETGRGNLTRGEGVISLGRAFKYAGCHNVLMSLWQADDQATSEIMQGFYTHLKDGKGKAEAIHLAKLDYLLYSNRKNHPFYWSAFVLIGDDLPLQDQGNGYWLIFGVLVLLGFAAFVTLRKKRGQVD